MQHVRQPNNYLTVYLYVTIKVTNKMKFLLMHKTNNEISLALAL